MEELERTAAALERTQYLLERMLELAERSADERCTDQRRVALQKGFAFLRVEALEALGKAKGEDT